MYAWTKFCFSEDWNLNEYDDMDRIFRSRNQWKYILRRMLIIWAVKHSWITIRFPSPQGLNLICINFQADKRDFNCIPFGLLRKSASSSRFAHSLCHFQKEYWPERGMSYRGRVDGRFACHAPLSLSLLICSSFPSCSCWQMWGPERIDRCGIWCLAAHIAEYDYCTTELITHLHYALR